MKHFFKLLLPMLALPLLLMSCGEDDTREVSLTPDKTAITANGSDKVTFTVKYGDDVVTSGVKITANGEEITGSSFSTTTAGEYKFVAEYKGKTSKEILVNAHKADALTLSVDKTTIIGNGTDKAVFTVKLGDEDVTAGAKIYTKEGTELSVKEFTSTKAGSYEFYAVYNAEESNAVTIVVEAASAGALLLTVDKATINADGEDEARFTVTRNGVDITADCNVCMISGSCLISPVFTSDEPGEYEFYASLKDDESVKSNYIKVTVVSTASIILSVDKASITADGKDEAKFTVMRDGVDITADCNVCMISGSCLISPVFTSDEPGEYEFYASLKDDENVKSNNVTVTAVAAAVLQLSADKTTIKGNGVEEAVFTVKLNGQDVTSSSEIYKGGVKMESNKFSGYEAGEFEFSAKYQGNESNAVKITVQKVDLLLSADKSTVKADGTDAVTFTAKLGDIDVTSGVIIKYGSGTALDSNTFVTSEAGEYEFTATLKAAESISSNTLMITAVADTPDELALSVDRSSIVANGVDKATFTITLNGTHINSAKLFCNGEVFNSKEFMGSLPGDYVFQANYEGDGIFVESNAVTVTVTAIEDDFDASRALHKNVAFFTFTATWCDPCYTFKSEMKKVLPDLAGNIVQMNFYTNDSKDEVKSSVSGTLSSQLTAKGFDMRYIPTPIVELTETVSSSESSIRTAVNKYLAKSVKTGIKVDSRIEGNKINVDVTVGAKEAGTYSVGIFLTEDNISAYQNGFGEGYNHTDVLRAKGMTNIFGDEIGGLAAGQSYPKSFSFDISSSYNTSNLNLVVYTLYEDNGKMVVSNVVKVPIDGFTDYNYAN